MPHSPPPVVGARPPAAALTVPPVIRVSRPLAWVGSFGFVKVHNSREHTHSRGSRHASRLPFCTWLPSFPGSHFSQCGAACAPSRLAAWGMISPALTLRVPGSDSVIPLLGGCVCVLCSAVKVHGVHWGYPLGTMQEYHRVTPLSTPFFTFVGIDN